MHLALDNWGEVLHRVRACALKANGFARCRPWSAAARGRTGASGALCNATQCVMHSR